MAGSSAITGPKTETGERPDGDRNRAAPGGCRTPAAASRSRQGDGWRRSPPRTGRPRASPAHPDHGQQRVLEIGVVELIGLRGPRVVADQRVGERRRDHEDDRGQRQSEASAGQRRQAVARPSAMKAGLGSGSGARGTATERQPVARVVEKKIAQTPRITLASARQLVLRSATAPAIPIASTGVTVNSPRPASSRSMLLLRSGTEIPKNPPLFRPRTEWPLRPGSAIALA